MQVLEAGLEPFDQGLLGPGYLELSLEKEVWSAHRQVPLAMQTLYFPCGRLVGRRKARARIF